MAVSDDNSVSDLQKAFGVIKKNEVSEAEYLLMLHRVFENAMSAKNQDTIIAVVNTGDLEQNKLDTTLLHAIEHDWYDVAEAILKKNSDVNQNKGFPLCVAVKYGRLNHVKLLDKYKADLNINKGWPLQEAVACDRFDIATYLLERGAQVDADDGLALLRAVNRNKKRFVKLLIKHHASVNLNSAYATYVNPIIEAVQQNNVEIAEILLENGAKVDVQNNRPLVHAVKQNSINMVQLLLKYGANANDREGEFLQIAKHNHYDKILKFLQEHIAKQEDITANIVSGEEIEEPESDEAKCDDVVENDITESTDTPSTITITFSTTSDNIPFITDLLNKHNVSQVTISKIQNKH